MPNSSFDNDKALHLLAKRLRPDFDFVSHVQWIDNEFHENNKYICLICGEELCDIMEAIDDAVEDGDDNSQWTKHGVQHLKENNLLPFV